MSIPGQAVSLEQQIAQWRSYLGRRQAIHAVDLVELEDHLREQIAALGAAGLADDEAFLVAVKRMGDLDALSREFAREHSERLWKQLVVPRSESGGSAIPWLDAMVAFGLAVAAAVLVKLPALFGLRLDTDADVYARNASLFVLPLLTGYFAWKRRLSPAIVRWLPLGFVAALLLANAYPFAKGGDTGILAALHLPIALWLVVGIAYAGGRWSQVAGRMDFVRFSGELFIYYTLIGFGGAVLMAFTAMVFAAIGIEVEPFFQSWLLPCGAAGAVLVASWLVEAKQSVIENMAPVLTQLFTPLFAAALIAFLGAWLWTGRGVDIERNVLIGFDLLLVVVVCLLLYSISARDRHAAPGFFDVMRIVLVVSALLADAVALSAIAARISEFGFSPNRVAALGENVILLVNLAGSAVLYLRFLRGRALFSDLERWQTNYLPVYAGWGALVAVVFPPAFGYL
ncbi:permease prefix domain 1-containing protein [Fulvimonas yonginensis]|uniref:Permease prefix domain 1-containing protein n=1 Tax=Fulvimonas yonginensis TaxID=1495200 RepID=A0ABU8JDC5_9GAMM